MTDLKTLAMAANSAHPCVPWHNSDDLIAIGIDDDCDADFVAAASPDAILKLMEERDRLKNDLADALDCKNGTGPSALSMVLSECDRLREALAQIRKEPSETLSDGKALKAIIKIARQALEEAR